MWRWLSCREKTIAEFAFPHGIILTKAWRRILTHFTLALSLAVATGFVNLTLQIWVAGLGGFVVFSQALWKTLDDGPAFRTIVNGGIAIPLYAAFPVSFRGLSRVLLKCCLIQMPLLLLLTTVTAAVVNYYWYHDAGRGALLGARAAFLFIGCRYFKLVFAFSSGTGDTAAFRLRTLMLLGFFSLFGLLFMALAAVAIFLPFEVASWICCGAAVLVAYIFFRIYGWFYHANRFDLMREPR